MIHFSARNVGSGCTRVIPQDWITKDIFSQKTGRIRTIHPLRFIGGTKSDTLYLFFLQKPWTRCVHNAPVASKCRLRNSMKLRNRCNRSRSRFLCHWHLERGVATSARELLRWDVLEWEDTRKTDVVWLGCWALLVIVDFSWGWLCGFEVSGM